MNSAELQISFDANRVKRKTESSNPIPSDLVGENIGVVFFTRANPSSTQIPEINGTDGRMHYNQLDWRSENLLVSNTNNYYYAPEAKNKQDIMNNILLSGGIELVTKRFKIESAKYNFTYLEVPLYVLYEYKMADGDLFGGLGPYFAYGIGGKTKFNDVSFNTFSDDGGFKKFDAGISFMAGYKMRKGFRFYLAFDDGLANIEIDGNAKERIRSKTVSLNASYPFNKLFKQKGKATK